MSRKPRKPRWSPTVLYPIKRTDGRRDRRFIVHDTWVGLDEPMWVGLRCGEPVTGFYRTSEAASAYLVDMHALGAL